jgi:hypothetical protein
MSRAILLRAAAVAALIVQVSLGAPAALAASATQSQNPDLTVSLSVPDQAAVGQTIAATMSISNNSSKIQTIAVRGIWTEPSGEQTVQTKNGLLLPGQTVTRVIDYAVKDDVEPGIHEITLSVESKSGTSSASAPIEVI